MKINDSNLISKVSEIKQITIDSYVKANDIKRIDLLKIDTQGYEKECLLGAKNSLKLGIIKMLKLEIMFSNYYSKNSSFFEIENIINPLGYRLLNIAALKKALNWDVHYGL